MPVLPPAYIGRDAVTHLVEYCRTNHLTQFVLVADENTYPALGASVEQALRSAGGDVLAIVLHGKEVIADEHYLIQVLTRVDQERRTYLAVGGGTLTDISRFASYRTRTSFISIPTAPSVDGFTSTGAPLVVEGLKRTYSCHAPVALFADLPTLTAAPAPLIAAGFGDMVGKFLSVADWQLGHVLWDERWDAGIAQQVLRAAQSCVDAAGEIGARSERGIQALITGLVNSGYGMLSFGNSAPASGGEHHVSHHWEMMLLRTGRPAILHGLKVGIASVLMSHRYHAVRHLTRDQAADRLRWLEQFTREEQEQKIRRAYGPMADELIQEQSAFLNWNSEDYSQLRQRVLDHWEDVQAIASTVPEPQHLSEWLNRVGAPAVPGVVGLSAMETADALEACHYLRNRFTINKLWFVLGFSEHRVE